MKCIIGGYAGRIGECAVWAAQKLGFEVVGFDQSSTKEDYINEKYNLKRFKINDDFKDSHIFISCLPYFENKVCSKHATESNIAWIDLGGHRETSRDIQKLVKEAPMMTDAGLAPGIAQIIAEKGLDDLGGADSIIISVGGLPLNPNINPLMYVNSWSFDGLYNNMTDKCEVLENGEIIEKEAGDELHSLDFPQIELYQFEDFLTSGGYSPLFLESLRERGVKNCRYKTIRYDGHLKLFKWLISELPKQEIAKLIQPKNSFKDIVIVNVTMSKGQKIWNETNFWGPSQLFSSMQRSTAFSLVASAKNMIGKKGLLNYKDFNNEEFFEDFEYLMGEDK